MAVSKKEMWAIYLLTLASLTPVSQSIKCQKCDSPQGDCNTGVCEGVWCSAAILENKATGTRTLHKDCNALNPTGGKDDGCVKDPLPDGSESFRCGCGSGDFCNSEANVARMQSMLNNRFIVGGSPNVGGAVGTGGAANPFPAAGQQNPPPGSIGQQPPPVPGGNPFQPSPPNGPNPNGSITDQSSGGQQQPPPGSASNQQPNSQPNDHPAPQQQPGSPNQFNPNPNPGQQQQPGSPNQFNPNPGQQFPPQQGSNSNGPSLQGSGNPQFPPSSGNNPQFPPQSGGNNPPLSPQGGSNPQFPQGGNNAQFPQPNSGTNVQQPTLGNNNNNPQQGPQPGGGSNSQFPQGQGGAAGGFPPTSPTDGGVGGGGARTNANPQPDSSNGNNGANPPFGSNSSSRAFGGAAGPSANGNPQGNQQTPPTSSNSGSLSCACSEPSCNNAPCKGAVCYEMTFSAHNVQNQAFAGRQGEIVQTGCTDDTNVLIGGAQHLRRAISDYRFRVANGQEVVVPAQAFYCRDGDYCNGVGKLVSATLTLLAAACFAFAFQRF